MSSRSNDNSISQPVQMPPLRSPRARQVARWFGLSSRRAYKRGQAHAGALAAPVKLLAGTITLVTGASGAGKSSLLRAVRAAQHRKILDIAAIDLSPVALVDLFELPLPETLLLLGRVGLGEAYTYLHTPAELSDGQRWRLRLALAVHKLTCDPTQTHRQRPILLADEFCTMLDRITALVIARALRRTIDAHPQLAALVATSHEDLQPALCPDVVVRCDFGAMRIVRP